MYLFCLTAANLLAPPNHWVLVILPPMFTFKLSLFSCFTSGSVCVHVWMLFFFTFITAVADTCVVVYLPVHVRLVPHPCCSLNSVDAVLSEDIAVRVPTLGGRGGGKARICLEILLEQPAIYLHWSSGDRVHKGFITMMMVSINHIYGIVLRQIGCDPILRD